MKKLFIFSLLSMSALTVHAAKYNCILSNGSENDPHAITYQFDTVEEDNKFVDMGQGSSVGCVVLRVKPQIITCGLGNDVNFSIFATADDGTSVLGLQTNSQGNKSSLSCVKQP